MPFYGNPDYMETRVKHKKSTLPINLNAIPIANTPAAIKTTTLIPSTILFFKKFDNRKYLLPNLATMEPQNLSSASEFSSNFKKRRKVI